MSHKDWTNPNSDTWLGLKRTMRQRAAEVMTYALRYKKLNRSDIERGCEVSTPTAAKIIAIIQERTGALEYDDRRRRYVLKEGVR